MEAKELMMDNYIQIEDNTFSEYLSCLDLDENDTIPDNNCLKVTGIDADEVRILIFDQEPFSYKDIKPIPLTEQWLIDFGFKVRKINNLFNEYLLECTPPNYKKEYFLSFRFGTRNDKDFEFYWYPVTYSGDMHVFPCEYVNQLQNLYFALTGKQLTKV